MSDKAEARGCDVIDTTATVPNIENNILFLNSNDILITGKNKTVNFSSANSSYCIKIVHRTKTFQRELLEIKTAFEIGKFPECLIGQCQH